MAWLTTILQDCRARLCSVEQRLLQMLGERIRDKSTQIEAARQPKRQN
jgi:hypothetical protein